jgi:hypothetical protein
MSDPVAREMTLRIATDHERLAEHTQRRRAFRPKPIAHAIQFLRLGAPSS